VIDLFPDRPSRALASSRIGFRSLPIGRQTTPVPDSPVRAEIHKSLDVHRSFSAKVALHGEFRDDVSELRDFRFAQILDLNCRIYFGHLACKAGAIAADTKDMRQSDDDLFINGDVNTGYTSHMCFLNPVAAYGVDRSKSLAPHLFAAQSCSYGRSFLPML
jgi:hypothetical protein